MKNLNYLDEFRITLHGEKGDSSNGCFDLKIKGEKYFVIASNGAGWEHVSISHEHKIPSWSTMCILKDMFFHDEEAVMQLHPPKREYVNNFPNCLHLWKPIKKEIPLPNSLLVGFK